MLERRLLFVPIAALGIISCGSKNAACPAKAPATSSSAAAPASWPQQQRDATILVTSALPDDVKSTFISRIAQTSLPDAWGAAGVGWSSGGSGFFLRPEKASNRLFAITNHHVVHGASTVSIQLAPHVTITDCPVAYTDDHHDVAVIALPDVPGEVAASIHLASLANHVAHDNQGVDASGFPAVSNDQSYRLTQGTVSNASFKFNIDGRDEPFIQHTAPIDHGSSGGPLFEKDSLVVLGINTLSIPMDANLYCAIPSDVISNAIDAAMHVPDVAQLAPSTKLINDTCRQLVQELSMAGDTPEHTAEILSDFLVADKGIAAWSQKFEGSGEPNDDARGDLRDSIATGAVMTFLRPVVLAKMFAELSTLGDGRCKEDNVNATDLRDYGATKQVRQRVDFGPDDSSFRTFFWKMEQGHWRLASYQ